MDCTTKFTKNEKKVEKIKTGMNHEEYILYKLSKLSNVNKALAKDMVKSLGEWTNPKEAAEYLTKYISTIYDKINSKEILARKLGNKYVIYTKSLVLLLEEIND